MLTPAQIKERRKGIGGSDAAKIVSGDWHELWLDKTGRKEPEDLSGVFAVQMGNATEELNLDWYERVVGRAAARRGEVAICKGVPILRCTLDGFDIEDGTVIQAKHVNGFSKIDDVRARYTPQVMHECLCCGVTRGILSVIIGTSEPILELIELDDFWATDYIDKCKQFWQHVLDDRAPEQGAPLPEPPAPTVMRTVDMTGNNVFGAYAADWLATKTHAKTFKDAEKAIKEQVEPDVRLAKGFGIEVSRNKAGSLSIKERK